MTVRLTDFKVLTFDCYGTLIDWESGIWDALQPLLMHNRVDRILRHDALALFARFESAQEAALLAVSRYFPPENGPVNDYYSVRARMQLAA